jgi:hypothetical protein
MNGKNRRRFDHVQNPNQRFACKSENRQRGNEDDPGRHVFSSLFSSPSLFFSLFEINAKSRDDKS